MNSMDTKLFVFSRKEVALIFFIVLSLTLTSFALGVKFGKRYYLQLAGIQETDVQEVELKSIEEEQVGKIMHNKEESEVDTQEINKEGGTDLMHEKLKEQIINELKKENDSADTGGADIIEQAEESGSADIIAAASVEEKTKDDELAAVEEKLPKKDSYSGKYTIQLGSHRSLKEAEDFASGFKIRGYNPIVNEVQLKNTGVWFRVSLGVFDTVSEAKEYVLKEKSLFEGQDYLFVQFD